jgi:hypothetical protein
VAAVEVAIAAKPAPKKKTVIIPFRLQRSASQPDGKENRPKAMNPGVAYGINSAYDRPHSRIRTSAATVAKISMNR